MAVRLRKLPPTIFQRFFRTQTAGGSVLLLFAVAALALANSPLAAPYAGIWRTPLTVGIADYSLSLTLHQWINDGLMAVFFLLVGLEIKRELVVSELASVRTAALPIACAIGGMIVPAAVYWIFNPIGFGAGGWGIPFATDIAFALGALALIAPGAPTGARVFLTALAIVDDVGGGACHCYFLFTNYRLGGARRRRPAGFGVVRFQRNWSASPVAIFVSRSGALVFCASVRGARDGCWSGPCFHHSHAHTDQCSGILSGGALTFGSI
jgi:hypothetical protein